MLEYKCQAIKVRRRAFWCVASVASYSDKQVTHSRVMLMQQSIGFCTASSYAYLYQPSIILSISWLVKEAPHLFFKL